MLSSYLPMLHFAPYYSPLHYYLKIMINYFGFKVCVHSDTITYITVVFTDMLWWYQSYYFNWTRKLTTINCFFYLPCRVHFLDDFLHLLDRHYVSASFKQVYPRALH